MDDNSGTFQGGDHVLEIGVHNSSTSFSQLLFSNDDHDCILGFDHQIKTPTMLCFGDGGEFNNDHQSAINGCGGEQEIMHVIIPTKTTPKKSRVTCNDTSNSVPPCNKNRAVQVNTATSSSDRKRNNGQSQELVTSTSSGTTCSTITSSSTNVTRTHVAIDRSCSKKTKMEISTSSTTSNPGHAKVKKEKLGERISALQQLVSPFGKTDTASVLHEAMGYIKFLQDQIQVLCSPYLQPPHLPEGVEFGQESRKELRSRGLCLVPIEFTLHVAGNNTNGADYWSPALIGGNTHFSSSSS